MQKQKAENAYLHFAFVATAIMNLVFIAAFVVHGLSDLALISLASLLSSFTSIYLLSQQKIRFSIMLNATVFYGNLWVITFFIGRDYGLEMLFWAIAYLVATNININFKLAVWFCIFIVTTNAILVIFTPSEPSIVLYPDHAYLYFTAFTIIAGVVLITGLITLKTVYIGLETRLNKLANFDALTGLHNRRFFYTYLELQKTIAKREKTPICIALGDIDKFKSINDTLGHDAGDLVLQSIATLANSSLSDGAEMCRWGGEEFLFFFANTNLDAAHLKANSLRESIAKQSIIERPVTMSFGLVEVGAKESIDQAIKRADILLYEAKNLGRNYVQV
jgi:diguanylate cyclase (GGDEF)-like protein